MICDRCKQDKGDVELEPSVSTLVFGPYPGSYYFGTPDHVNYEYRCSDCEKEVAKNLKQMIKNANK